MIESGVEKKTTQVTRDGSKADVRDESKKVIRKKLTSLCEDARDRSAHAGAMPASEEAGG